jgi:hypothetical protein
MFFIPTNLQNHNDMTKVQTIFDINTITVSNATLNLAYNTNSTHVKRTWKLRTTKVSDLFRFGTCQK